MSSTTKPLSPKGVILSNRFNEATDESDAFVLGAAGVVEKLQWHKSGRGNVLVSKAESEHAMTAEEEPEAATLVFFGMMKPDKFFLTSTGGYTKPTKETPRLADAKGNAVLGAPGVGDDLDDVFRLAVQQADLLRDNVDTDTKKAMRGAMDGAGADHGLKLRHASFEGANIVAYKLISHGGLCAAYARLLVSC
ncbi:hypothetical protein B0H12DRAFT_1240569 [Mycena haematopus]|nr:hypothetical protein B0H12DRAFT_1240569 [Mycena haematopus]